MRYSWDISSCNQTWRARTSISYSSMFFPSWGKPWFPDFPMNRSDSTRNETENVRIGGLTPQFMAIQNGNMILGNVFKMVPKHGSFYYSENEVQNSKPSIFRVLYGFLEQTQMGKQRDRMFFFSGPFNSPSNP